MKYERYIDGINYQQPCSNDNWYSFVDKNSVVLGKLGILKPTSEELKGISRRRIDVGNWQQKYLSKYCSWRRKQTRIFEGRPQQWKTLGCTLQTSWPRKRAFLRSRCQSYYRRLEVDVYDWDWEGRSSFYWPLSWLEPGLVYAITNAMLCQRLLFAYLEKEGARSVYWYNMCKYRLETRYLRKAYLVCIRNLLQMYKQYEARIWSSIRLELELISMLACE